jgi:hypothetical protein
MIHQPRDDDEDDQTPPEVKWEKIDSTKLPALARSGCTYYVLLDNAIDKHNPQKAVGVILNQQNQIIERILICDERAPDRIFFRNDPQFCFKTERLTSPVEARNIILRDFERLNLQKNLDGLLPILSNLPSPKADMRRF